MLASSDARQVALFSRRQWRGWSVVESRVKRTEECGCDKDDRSCVAKKGRQQAGQGRGLRAGQRRAGQEATSYFGFLSSPGPLTRCMLWITEWKHRRAVPACVRAVARMRRVEFKFQGPRVAKTGYDWSLVDGTSSGACALTSLRATQVHTQEIIRGAIFRCQHTENEGARRRLRQNGSALRLTARS